MPRVRIKKAPSPPRQPKPASPKPVEGRYYWFKPHGGQTWNLALYKGGLWYAIGDAFAYGAVRKFVDAKISPPED